MYYDKKKGRRAGVSVFNLSFKFCREEMHQLEMAYMGLVCKKMDLHGRFEYDSQCMMFCEFVVIK